MSAAGPLAMTGQGAGPEAGLPLRLRPGAAPGIALWAFIGVATSLFSLFIVAYVMRMSSPDATAIAMPWQLWLSSAWLVAGSMLMQRAAMLGGRAALARWPLRAAGACALAFVVVQWWAWQALLGQQVSLQGNPAGSFFYLLTAMHALHVAGGLVGWLVTMQVLRREPGGADESWRIALCARYWHFLLAVWLALFAALGLISPELAAAICGTSR